MSKNVIKILRYKEHKSNTLCGFFDVHIERYLSEDKKCGMLGVTIKGLSHFSNDVKEWVSFPSREYTDPEGNKKYAASIWIEDRGNMELFLSAILQAVKESVKNVVEQSDEEEDWNSI